MNKFKILLLIIFSFSNISCGTKTNPEFKIEITTKSDFLKNGDIIKLRINNPTNYDLKNIQFKINDSLIDSNYVLNNKLGKNNIQATFKFDENIQIVNKEITIFSNINPKLYSYKIINEFDHDISSYTQGLEFDNQYNLFESTGQYGYSSLRKIDFSSGKILDKLFLDKSYFGEGLTIIGDNLYQLTWKQKIGFIYNKNNFDGF